MKKVKFKLPIGKADAFALFAIEYDLQTVLSWSVADWFDGWLYVICAINETDTQLQETINNSSFKQYIIQ